MTVLFDEARVVIFKLTDSVDASPIGSRRDKILAYTSEVQLVDARPDLFARERFN